jgi:hypothetical protein
MMVVPRSCAVLAMLLVACAKPSTRTVQAPRATPAPCRLEPKLVNVVAKPVAGYPMVIVRPSPQELATRLRELEARVPGWALELNRDGFPIAAESEPIGAWSPTISQDRIERVRRMLVTLADDFAVARDVHLTVEGDKYIAVREGHADPTIIAEQIGAKYAQLRRQSAKVANKPLVVPDPYADDNLVVLKVAVQRPRTIPIPTLPTGVRELTNDEIKAMWAPAFETTHVLVVKIPRQMQCDPVGPDDCHMSEPPRAVACVRANQLSFARSVVQTDTEVRHVITLSPPGEQDLHFDYGANGPATNGYAGVHVHAALPLCIDAVTGEGIEQLGLCRLR